MRNSLTNERQQKWLHRFWQLKKKTVRRVSGNQQKTGTNYWIWKINWRKMCKFVLLGSEWQSSSNSTEQKSFFHFLVNDSCTVESWDNSEADREPQCPDPPWRIWISQTAFLDRWNNRWRLLDCNGNMHDELHVTVNDQLYEIPFRNAYPVYAFIKLIYVVLSPTNHRLGRLCEQQT